MREKRQRRERLDLILAGALPAGDLGWRPVSGWQRIGHDAHLQGLAVFAKANYHLHDPQIKYIAACLEQAKFQGAPADQLAAIEEELAYWIAERMES